MRRIAAIANILAATTLMTVASLTPASAESVTNPLPPNNQAIDNHFLNGWQDGSGGTWAAPMTPTSVLGSTVSNYCNRVAGIVGPQQPGATSNQCVLYGFTETQRTKYDIQYSRRVSTADYVECNEKQRSSGASVSYANTVTTTTTTGKSLSMSSSLTFSANPFGIGVQGSFTTTGTWNWEFSTGISTTKTDSYPVNPDPGYRSWLMYSTYHGTSHGIATVMVMANPAAGIPRTGIYDVVTDLSGDLPAPKDPNSDAYRVQPNGVSFSTPTQRLTNAELLQQCPFWYTRNGVPQEWVADGPGVNNGTYRDRPDRLPNFIV
ncbi:hypothetical protein [Streptomyces sp. NPDC001635]